MRRYNLRVIKSFRHAGLENFFLSGSKAGIQAKHAGELSVQLFALNRAKSSSDMAAPGWNLHRLRGNLQGHCSVKVDGNWRLTFTFDGEDAVLVDYHDYH